MKTLIASGASRASKRLTYEAYMAEETDYRRYDIEDGEKILMPGATKMHQDTLGNIYVAFREVVIRTKIGTATLAPRDVLISHSPLRTRQPGVMFMSSQRIALNPVADDPAPASPAPELVVEIISGSETARRFNGKVKDYCKVDVKECWKVMPKTQTVEVLQLSPSGSQSVQTCGMGETVQSVTFNDLRVAVDDIFAK